jgi:hypothetical protein
VGLCSTPRNHAKVYEDILVYLHVYSTRDYDKRCFECWSSFIVCAPEDLDPFYSQVGVRRMWAFLFKRQVPSFSLIRNGRHIKVNH